MRYDWNRFTFWDKICFILLVIFTTPFCLCLGIVGKLGEFCIELLQCINSFIQKNVDFPIKGVDKS